MFLQIQQTENVFLNYGPLGAFVVVCLIVIYAMGRFFSRQYEKLESKMDKYISEDRAKMMEVIEKNTLAFNELRNELHQQNNK